MILIINIIFIIFLVNKWPNFFSVIRIKLPTSAGSWKKQESSRKNIYFYFIDYAKAFDGVDHDKLWKIFQEMGIPDHLSASWEMCMQVKKQQLELDMEQQTASKQGKEYIKAIYYLI